MQLVATSGVNGFARVSNVEQYIDCIVCPDSKRKECFHSECDVCRSKKFDLVPAYSTMRIWWWKWKTTIHKMGWKGEEKVKREGTVQELCDLFQKKIPEELFQHVYNIRHQYT